VPAKVDGTWQTPRGTLTLKQDFQMLSGTLGTMPITEGKLRGEEITFKVGTTQYTGRVKGNAIEGTIGGGGTWTARRS
jgi:hypothetical protein